jgi:hypothetical protein
MLRGAETDGGMGGFRRPGQVRDLPGPPHAHGCRMGLLLLRWMSPRRSSEAGMSMVTVSLEQLLDVAG